MRFDADGHDPRAAYYRRLDAACRLRPMGYGERIVASSLSFPFNGQAGQQRKH
jgi:hypothetical protein